MGGGSEDDESTTKGVDDVYRRSTEIRSKVTSVNITKYVLGFIIALVVAFTSTLFIDGVHPLAVPVYGCCGWFIFLILVIIGSSFMKKKTKKTQQVKKGGAGTEETEDQVVKKVELDEVKELERDDYEVYEKDDHLDKCPKCGKNTLKLDSDGTLECKNCDYPKID